METKDFYDRIKSSLVLKNCTMVQMCHACSIPYQNFVNKRTRKTYPSLPECYRIAKYLGVSIEYLLTGENPDSNIIPNYENTVMKDKLNRIAEILNSDV